MKKDTVKKGQRITDYPPWSVRISLETRTACRKAAEKKQKLLNEWLGEVLREAAQTVLTSKPKPPASPQKDLLELLETQIKKQEAMEKKLNALVDAQQSNAEAETPKKKKFLGIFG